MASPVLFHIGYHKTATTWLQRRLFTTRYLFEQLASHAEVNRLIVAPHGLDFDASAMRQLLAERVRRMSNAHTGVVSSELLSGNPFRGGIGSDVYARRLREITGDARILVTIRSQRRLLVSIYMQYLLRGGTMPPAQFFAGEADLGYEAFRPAHFEFDRLIALYRDLFGAANVHVTTQESIAVDAQAAAAEIAVFAGNDEFTGLDPTELRPEAPSYPEYAAPVLRRINHVQTSVLNPRPIVSVGRTPHGLYKVAGYLLRRPLARRLLSRYRPVSAYVDRHLADRYSESNRRLAKMMPGRLDLSAYP